MGFGFFFNPSPVALWSWQLNLNGCAWCWVVHRTISRLKCDCFNTLIHLSLAFRMLQKSPNYFSALYPSWLKYSRRSSSFLLINKSILPEFLQWIALKWKSICSQGSYIIIQHKTSDMFLKCIRNWNFKNACVQRGSEKPPNQASH